MTDESTTVATGAAGTGTMDVTAYRFDNDEDWLIAPAKMQRDWMDQTMMKAAYRCLPLAMANQAGWLVHSPATFKARWTSRKAEPDSLQITFASEQDQRYAGAIKSNFGLGIITFVLPWLFRTPQGIGMLVRGPSNMPRSDVVALEGLVETDWLTAPFTMNWKIVKPKVDVYFKKGDPICMITPYPIDLIEQVQPRIRPIQADRELNANFERAKQIRTLATRRGDTMEGKFELNYTRGARPDGEKVDEHRTNLKLRPFEAFPH